VLTGAFMAMEWSTQHIFLALTVPAVVSATAMYSLAWSMRPEHRTGLASQH